MSAEVELKPGRTPLIDWRAIYRGAAASLDPFARPDVDAGSAALADFLAREKTASAVGAPSLAELMEAGGDRLPAPLIRLFVALKLASLAQGLSGVRWDTLRGLADFLAAGLLPAVPADASDRVALACLFAAVTGTGEAVQGDKRLPAAKALKEAELFPLGLDSGERPALLSGATLSTAAALAGLFEAERVFRSALVATALSANAMRCPIATYHPRAYELHRQAGQIEVAASLRSLAGCAEPRHAGGPDRHELGAAPMQLGACLDLLRQAGATLELAANAVTEAPLVLWQVGEVVPGVEDRSSIESAANVVALVLARIAELSQARIAMLNASVADAPIGDGEGAGPATRAAGFVARVHAFAGKVPVERSLLAMAGTVTLVLAIELLEAERARPADYGGIPGALEDALRLVREAAPRSDVAGLSPAAGLAAIAERIGSGALAAAVGVSLPSVVLRRSAAR